MKSLSFKLLVLCAGYSVFASTGYLRADDSLEVAFSKSIKEDKPDAVFDLLSKPLEPNQKWPEANQTVSEATLKLFYEKFKKQMWQFHHGQRLWMRFIFLNEQTGKNAIIDQVIEDCVFFDFFKEPGVSPWRSRAHFPEYSKIREITKWVYRYKGMEGIQTMYLKALNNSKGDLALGIILNLPAVEDEKATLNLAQKRINAYDELRKLGIPNEDMTRLYDDERVDDPISEDRERVGLFKMSGYVEQLRDKAKKSEITKEQKSILNQLDAIVSKLAEPSK